MKDFQGTDMGMLYMYESCMSQRRFQTAPFLYSEEINIPPAKVQHDVLCKNRQSLTGKFYSASEFKMLRFAACTHDVLQVQVMNISFSARYKFDLLCVCPCWC
jgi:hypothetical protein